MVSYSSSREHRYYFCWCYFMCSPCVLVKLWLISLSQKYTGTKLHLLSSWRTLFSLQLEIKHILSRIKICFFLEFFFLHGKNKEDTREILELLERCWGKSTIFSMRFPLFWKLTKRRILFLMKFKSDMSVEMCFQSVSHLINYTFLFCIDKMSL